MTVLYHMPQKLAAKQELAKREAELVAIKAAHNIPDAGA